MLITPDFKHPVAKDEQARPGRDEARVNREVRAAQNSHHRTGRGERNRGRHVWRKEKRGVVSSTGPGRALTSCFNAFTIRLKIKDHRTRVSHSAQILLKRRMGNYWTLVASS